MGDFVLPDSAVALIHQISDDEQRPQFAIGDVAVELIDEFADKYPKSVVRNAIAMEYRCGPETIRDREWVSRKVAPGLRSRYDVLSFHQWKAIAGAKTYDDMLRYAEWAVRSADQYRGRPAPVSAIRRKMRNGGDETPVWEKRWDKVVELLELIALDDKADVDHRKFCRQVLSVVKDKGLV